MRQSLIIAQRELRSFFDSLIAYVLLVLFLGFSGFFTWIAGNADIFFAKQASLGSFFGICYVTLFFFIPALTMRSLAEERKSGTIELLLTKDVTDRQVILGKFLATLGLIAIALLCTIPYVISVSRLGNLDAGVAFSGYMGLLLMSCAYIGIGIFASSLTENQIVAFLIAVLIGLFFHWIFDMIAFNLKGLPAEVLDFLSVRNRFQSVSKGVLDLRDILYFLSLAFFGLFLAEVSLTKRNISG